MPRLIDIKNEPFVKLLPYSFSKSELSLNGWGNVDCHAVCEGKLVLLEVETTQLHPNTNVLKLWPYLEQNENIKILLIHLFRPSHKASKNRVNLCCFVGQKLEELFPGRFRYFKCNKIGKVERQRISKLLSELS